MDDEVCEFCGGTGEYTIPAHQCGGNIVDEIIIRCKNCNSNDNKEDEDIESDF